jgi:hypothetical protein
MYVRYVNIASSIHIEKVLLLGFQLQKKIKNHPFITF